MGCWSPLFLGPGLVRGNCSSRLGHGLVRANREDIGPDLDRSLLPREGAPHASRPPSDEAKHHRDLVFPERSQLSAESPWPASSAPPPGLECSSTPSPRSCMLLGSCS
ncbi:hypothetical protein PAHAL_8G051100 [Panicum hallii]|uniref:Uncharacterized protein n=1 Tax=Panicum hallii TaxID=206008 RepID=A0A2S3ICW5_9POAL|nr:hypothetical protein PAHAL_8G051100 [Panicum hallii]